MRPVLQRSVRVHELIVQNSIGVRIWGVREEHGLLVIEGEREVRELDDRVVRQVVEEDVVHVHRGAREVCNDLGGCAEGQVRRIVPGPGVDLAEVEGGGDDLAGRAVLEGVSGVPCSVIG